MITLKNVSKTYETKDGTVHALQDVSLTINKGDIFGLFRGNGGLKTATTPVFIHAKRHSVFDLEVECVYQSIQGTPYRAYFVCF